MKILFCFVIINLISSLVAISQNETAINNCPTDTSECDETKFRWVCGTDNQTYLNRCHLNKARCRGHHVRLKHRGPCKECSESRSYAIAYMSSTSLNKFLPKCRSDGSYASVQCLKGVGCWCSDSQGKPIPNTTTTVGKPNCTKHRKINIRRSPSGNQNYNQDKRICRKSDQRLFNNNLVQAFYAEYKRQHQSLHPNNEQEVIDWKHSALDLNGDKVLDVTEYGAFKRIVRKIVKPKKCARLFGKNFYCDTNRDKLLSQQEWKSCFTEKNNHNGRGQGSTNFENSVHNEYDDELERGNERDYTVRPLYYDATITPYPPVYLLRPKMESDSSLHEPDIDSGCISDRAAALDEQKMLLNGGQVGYIPECTPDGRYQRVQCYRSVGYCWCVHEDTGKNIPGTSIKGARPNCSVSDNRPIKGCREPNEGDFFRELKEYLRDQISGKVKGVQTTNWKSEDERIATTSFVWIDNNKNRVLDKNEWRVFREIVSKSRSLQKCGRKMPRYCDVNNDKKITLSEWLSCLHVNTPMDEITAAPVTIGSNSNATKLKGPNPLDSYLKSD